MIEKWKRYCSGSNLLAWLTLVEAGVWACITLIMLAGKVFHFDVGIADWLTLPSKFSLFLSRPWTLVTYMAVHFDVLHILFNLLWLYWFGFILLTSLSDKYLGITFFGGGIFGGIIFLICAAFGYGAGWLCGCSAAVIAVMTTAAIRLPDYRVRLFLIGDVKLKWLALICCLLTFIGGGGNQAAHLGGLIWGAIVGLLLRNGIDPALLFTRKSNAYRGEDSRRSADRMVKVLQERRNDIKRLDELLDKIKLSGYESLTKKERNELNEISQRVK